MAAPMRLRCFHRNCQVICRLFHSPSTLMHNKCVRVRFAPSPTGMLHLGGLRTALYNYLFAKSQAGKFVLRIEDTDQTRLVPGAVQRLEDDLEWAGLSPDEGPHQGGSYGPYTQSERIELYHENIKVLLQNGTAYHCFCTSKRLELLRRDAARRGETPKYDNKCRHWTKAEVEEKLARNTPYVIRFKLEPVPEPWQDLVKGPVSHNVADIEGDPVLIKSDKFPTYHFANVVDDHYMKISHVLRGDEWMASTPKHILLYRAFGWQPPLFAHLPLILNKDGTKLSKRQGDINVEHFKEEGHFPEAVLNYVTQVGGGFSTDGTIGLTLDELIKRFSIDNVKSNSARLDPEFLKTANQIYLKMKLKDNHTREQFINDVKNLVSTRYVSRLDETIFKDVILSPDYIGNIMDWAVQENRLTKVQDLLNKEFEFLWTTPERENIDRLRSSDTDITVTLDKCVHRLESLTDFDMVSIGKDLQQLSKEQNSKRSKLMHDLRQALSGLTDGPPVAEMMSALGKENTIYRLRHALDCLAKS